MLKFLPYFQLSILAACAAPGVAVWGGGQSDIEIGEMRFTVNHTETRAEAYRRNIQFRPNRAEVFGSAVLAIEQISGCSVLQSSVSGDVALVQAEISC